MTKKTLTFCFIFLFIQQVYAKDVNVVLVSASSSTDPFWSQVGAIAQASANDLNINLTIYNNVSNRILLDELINKVIVAPNKPDYIIFMPFGGKIEQTFSLLEQAEISFVTLERTYEQQLYLDSIGRPLGKFSYWIGEVFFDNLKSSELLTQTLFTHAKNNNKNRKNNLTAVGLNGDFHPSSQKRSDGFLNISKQKSIQVKQVVYTNWLQDVAKEKFLKLANRHGVTDIIWCASDVNAIGALEGIQQLNLIPNQDVVIGGFDWTHLALQKIKTQELTASVGGHIFQGARALIKIYDYHHGIDTFNRDDSYQGYVLEVIDVDNIDNYQKLTQLKEWESIDFTIFSSAKQKEPTPFNTLNILTSIQ